MRLFWQFEQKTSACTNNYECHIKEMPNKYQLTFMV